MEGVLTESLILNVNNWVRITDTAAGCLMLVTVVSVMGGFAPLLCREWVVLLQKGGKRTLGPGAGKEQRNSH